MRRTLFLLLVLSGCARDMQGKWPSLATRSGEDAPAIPVTGPCATSGVGCGQDAAPPPVSAPALQPLPADTEARLASITALIAAVEAKAPAQARTATAAITAARRGPALSGDAEVERSRFESLFMPLSVEDRRLEILSDDVIGRDGADPVLARIEALRMRLTTLQTLRTSLPD